MSNVKELVLKKMMNFSTRAVCYQWYARYFCLYRWRLAKSKTRFLDHRYTREAGVRSLDRKLGAICRAVAVKVAEGQRKEAKLECPDAAPEGEGLCPGRAPSGLGTRGGRGSMAPVDGEVDADAARGQERPARPRRVPRPLSLVRLRAASSRLRRPGWPHGSLRLHRRWRERRVGGGPHGSPVLAPRCAARVGSGDRSLYGLGGSPPPQRAPLPPGSGAPPTPRPSSLFSGAVPACPARSFPRLSHSFCSWGFFLFKNFCHFNRIWRGTLKINTCSDHHLKKSEFLKSALGG